MIIVTKEIKEIVKRLSICWNLKDSFKEERKTVSLFLRLIKLLMSFIGKNRLTI